MHVRGVSVMLRVGNIMMMLLMLMVLSPSPICSLLSSRPHIQSCSVRSHRATGILLRVMRG
jgi:hypothetical protein